MIISRVREEVERISKLSLPFWITLGNLFANS
jgi:hypothetical protein